MKEFDWENWQEPKNVNLNSDIRTFWESVKDSLSEHGVILRLDDVIVSPFSVVLSINCDDHNATIGRPLVLYRLKDALEVFDGHPYVIESLPETCNIGIGLRRSYDDDSELSFTEMVNGDTYKELSDNSNAVPILLGIDHMNKHLVANLADSDNMFIIGSDTYDQSYTAELVVNGLMFGRSPYDLQMSVLDGSSFAIVSSYADLPYSKDSLSYPPQDKNMVAWCQRAISIFDEVERDCDMRRKIIKEANCDYDHIQEYNRASGKKMARRVIIMANLPDQSYNAPDKVREAVEKLKERVRIFIELDKSDVGVHFILWNFSISWNDPDLLLVDSLLRVKNKSQFVAYTRFDEMGSLLNFAGGMEACASNNLGPLVYRSPDGEIHYFQFAKVKDDERNLAIDKWGLTRTPVNDNIPDDEDDMEDDSNGEPVEIIAEPAGECVQEETPTLVLPKNRKTDFGDFAGKWNESETAAFNASVARGIDAEDRQ